MPRGTVRARQMLANVRPLPSAPNVEELFGKLSGKRNVLGCYIGIKRTGRKSTGRRSLVCLVKKKLPEDRIRHEDDVIPERLVWEDVGGNRHEVITDVVEGTGVIRYRAGFAGPGDDVRTSNGTLATVGIAMLHPRMGKVITTAGHAIQGTAGISDFPPAQAPRVKVSAFRGGTLTCDAAALRVHITEKSDYAILQPLGAVQCANLFRDQATVSHPFVPGAGDIGRAVLVLGAAGPRHTVFRGVHAHFLKHPSGISMKNLLITDDVTAPGDSGACLADVHNGDLRAWGLLVGSTIVDGWPVSIFTSVLSPMFFEQAEFLA